MLGIRRQAREYLNKSTKILLYNSLILPHLDYYYLVYMCTTEQNLQKLLQIQNIVCMIILKADSDTSVKQMHKDFDLPTLKQRHLIHVAMDCYNDIRNEEAGLLFFLCL